VAAAALALAAGGGLSWWRSRNVSAVQRGWAVAEAHGCFACHGAGGVTGQPDMGVPAFSRDDLEAYVKNEGEIREWILDGMPQRLRQEPAAASAEEASLTPMPAWRSILSPREVDDLVAYVRAVGEVDRPSEPAVEKGRLAAQRLGCFGCHGPQGRGSPPNPRSLKGYIPAWDGADFPELARSDAEVKEWIVDGRPRRLREDRLARYFMDRQLIQMPAYRGRITPEEVEQVLGYIGWLRRTRPAGGQARTRFQGSKAR
jgi:mono/diheme cytochrome c family protein